MVSSSPWSGIGWGWLDCIGTLVDRVAQGQQAGTAVGPGLLAQVLEDGARRGVADRLGFVVGEQDLDWNARHGPGGEDDQPAGSAADLAAATPGPWPAARGAGRELSTRGRRSARPRRPVPQPGRPGPRAPCPPWSTARRGPSPYRDPGRDASGANDHAPVLAVGVGSVGPTGGISTHAIRAASAGSAAWISFEPGDLARQGAVILDQLRLELTQGDAGQLAPVLQVFDRFAGTAWSRSLSVASASRSSRSARRSIRGGGRARRA